jgi:hypothetical protein
MNYSNYEPRIFQSPQFMESQGKNYIILNFSTHPVKPGFYPDYYPIVDLPMNVNIFAEDLDLIVFEYVKKTIQDAGYDINDFKPLVILPQFDPIKFLIFQIVSEIFAYVYAIITQISQNKDGKREPYYFVSSGVRKRLRPLRPELENKGLIVK